MQTARANKAACQQADAPATRTPSDTSPAGRLREAEDGVIRLRDALTAIRLIVAPVWTPWSLGPPLRSSASWRIFAAS